MTWKAYAKATEDPEWQAAHHRYLNRKATREVSAEQAFLGRLADIDDMHRIEKRYEEESKP